MLHLQHVSLNVQNKNILALADNFVYTEYYLFLLYDRDFVSVRQIAAQDGCYYSASQATTTALKPEQPGKVRYVLHCFYL